MATTEKKANVCPECGIDMTDRDPVGHSVGHYGERRLDPRINPDAAKRQAELLEKGEK